MNQLLAALALATAPLVASPALAAPVARVPVAAAPAKQLDRLIALLTPEDALLQLADRTFVAEIGRTLSPRDRVRPGLADYVATQLRPAFRKLLRKEIPALRREIRSAIAGRLTPAETRQALKFFASPTGMKLRAQVYKTLAEQPDLAPDAAQAAVLNAVMKTMRFGDYPPLMEFGASSAAGKMNAINPRIAEVSMAWSNRLVARHSKRMHGLAAAATQRYLKGRK